MKKIIFLMILVFLSVLIFSANSDDDELKDLSEKYAAAVLTGNFDAISAALDAKMKEVVTKEKLTQALDVIKFQVGELKKRTFQKIVKNSDYNVILYKCEYEKINLLFSLTLNGKNEISGFHFTPFKDETTLNLKETDKFSEKTINFGSTDWPLPGILTTPKGTGPFPFVILVHGSGPHDYDETIGPSKIFRDIAWGLAEKGIGILRYSKRTYVYTEKLSKVLPEITVMEETVDDAVLAIDFLKNQEKVEAKKIFVLGHSLGAMMIPKIAGLAPAAAGFIMMASPARPLEDLILEQYNYIFNLDGKIDKNEKTELEKLIKQVAIVKSKDLMTGTKADDLLFGAPYSYWIFLKNYSQRDEAIKINRPVYFALGGRDYQVTEVDLKLWEKYLTGKNNFTFKLYPNLNHLFAEGKKKSTPDEYLKENKVSLSFINDIADWIANNKK